MKNLIFLFSITVLIVTVVKAENEIYYTDCQYIGITDLSGGQETQVYPVETVQDCMKLCIENDGCNSITFNKNDPEQFTCFLQYWPEGTVSVDSVKNYNTDCGIYTRITEDIQSDDTHNLEKRGASCRNCLGRGLFRNG
jgi:hypothetical protein